MFLIFFSRSTATAKRVLPIAANLLFQNEFEDGLFSVGVENVIRFTFRAFHKLSLDKPLRRLLLRKHQSSTQFFPNYIIATKNFTELVHFSCKNWRGDWGIEGVDKSARDVSQRLKGRVASHIESPNDI